MAELLVSVHFAVTCLLAGLIWTVQVVVYPAFARVGAANFTVFHREHSRRISRLVVPLMPLEMLVAVWLAWDPPLTWPPGVAGGGLALVVSVWASTAFVQIPQHRRLARGGDPEAVSALVRGNWVRTVAWTLRAAGAATLQALG